MQARTKIAGMAANARRWPRVETVDRESDVDADRETANEPRLSRSGFERLMAEVPEIGAIQVSVSTPAVTVEATLTAGKSDCRDDRAILTLEDGGAARIHLDAVGAVVARREDSEFPSGAIVISDWHGRASWSVRPAEGSDGERFWWLVSKALDAEGEFVASPPSHANQRVSRGGFRPHAVHAAWTALRDPDRLNGLLDFHRLSRLDAFRAVAPELARPMSGRALEGLMRHLVATGTALSLRIGTTVGELRETTRLSRVGGTSESLRLATPRTLLRLRGAPHTQAFQVRYPGASETNTVELCGADGDLVFSARAAIGHDVAEWDVACARLSEGVVPRS
jgi:putative heme degradation protein